MGERVGVSIPFISRPSSELWQDICHDCTRLVQGLQRHNLRKIDPFSFSQLHLLLSNTLPFEALNQSTQKAKPIARVAINSAGQPFLPDLNGITLIPFPYPSPSNLCGLKIVASSHTLGPVSYTHLTLPTKRIV